MARGLGLRQQCRLCAAAVMVLAAIFSAPEQPADIVLTHARIYTVNPKQAWAEALAVRGGKIVAVGTESEISAYRGASTIPNSVNPRSMQRVSRRQLQFRAIENSAGSSDASSAGWLSPAVA